MISKNDIPKIPNKLSINKAPSQILARIKGALLTNYHNCNSTKSNENGSSTVELKRTQFNSSVLFISNGFFKENLKFLHEIYDSNVPDQIKSSIHKLKKSNIESKKQVENLVALNNFRNEPAQSTCNEYKSKNYRIKSKSKVHLFNKKHSENINSKIQVAFDFQANEQLVINNHKKKISHINFSDFFILQKMVYPSFQKFTFDKIITKKFPTGFCKYQFFTAIERREEADDNSYLLRPKKGNKSAAKKGSAIPKKHIKTSIKPMTKNGQMLNVNLEFDTNSNLGNSVVVDLPDQSNQQLIQPFIANDIPKIEHPPKVEEKYKSKWMKLIEFLLSSSNLSDVD